MAWLNAVLEPHHYDRWEETSAEPFGTYFAPNPGGGETTALWRDLSYNTDSQSYTLATGGFPLGNLNYFPEKKAEWVVTSVEEPAADLPGRFSLIGNYPNPFNPTTNIVFELAAASDVAFDVYNILGQKVRAVELGVYGAGRHTAIFDAKDLPSGVYVVRMLDDAVQAHRILLMK
jgi:hypothetical protein